MKPTPRLSLCNRLSLRNAFLVLALGSVALAGCGDDPKPTEEPATPAAPAKSESTVEKTVPEDVPEVVPIKKVVEAAEDAEEAASLAAGEAADAADEVLEKVENVADKLGVEITDENRETLKKLADVAGDEANQEKLRDAAKKLNEATGGAGLGGLGEKLGLGGGDEDGDVADIAKARGGKAAAGALAGKTAEASDLAGLSGDELRARRKAEVEALVKAHEEKLTGIRANFAERKKAKPGRAKALDARLATREKNVNAAHEAELAKIRARYKAAIAGAE